MKIGIFGCSFADETLHDATFPGYKSWSAYLRDYGYNVENFAVKGSSVWFSYDLYEQHKHKFDLIIFLQTTAGRYYAENIKAHLLPSIQSINGYKLEIANFYKFIFNKKYDETMIRLMIDKVLINPKVVHANAMDTIGKASRVENEVFKFEPGLNIETDNRFCHLSDLNNKLLAKYIHNCIENKQTIRFDSVWYQKPDISDRHKYFIPK